jgi:hypothetical protein
MNQSYQIEGSHKSNLLMMEIRTKASQYWKKNWSMNWRQSIKGVNQYFLTKING